MSVFLSIACQIWILLGLLVSVKKKRKIIACVDVMHGSLSRVMHLRYPGRTGNEGVIQ